MDESGQFKTCSSFVRTGTLHWFIMDARGSRHQMPRTASMARNRTKHYTKRKPWKQKRIQSRNYSILRLWIYQCPFPLRRGCGCRWWLVICTGVMLRKVTIKPIRGSVRVSVGVLHMRVFKSCGTFRQVIVRHFRRKGLKCIWFMQEKKRSLRWVLYSYTLKRVAVFLCRNPHPAQWWWRNCCPSGYTVSGVLVAVVLRAFRHHRHSNLCSHFPEQLPQRHCLLWEIKQAQFGKVWRT